MVPWGQGWRDMAPALDALEISVLERRFQHPGNPVLTFCFANAVSIADASGNRKMDKSATRFRIGGRVTAAMMRWPVRSRSRFEQVEGDMALGGVVQVDWIRLSVVLGSARLPLRATEKHTGCAISPGGGDRPPFLLQRIERAGVRTWGP